jgi:AhpD family alkylhydroperoxidase
MTKRINPYFIAPKVVQPLIEFGRSFIATSGLEPSLMHLIEIRASQINGCAVCLHMHSRDARKSGETEERVLMLNVWRESSLYTPRERAALAWTEALTLLATSHAPDDVYEMVRAQFTDEESVKLTMMISIINSFNRFGVGYRVDPSTVDKTAA